MKAAIIVLLLAVCALVMGAPLEEYSREKRVACDIIGKIKVGPVQLNDSACAAGCIIRGKKGGYCTKKLVCKCNS
ncbi:hypothetical protein L9F63_021612 [Diploptera punctata]|uniref:Invertebrate defensins family profile domain-containing protein n=1 Tax=Diploptera punctata TaxID=6984 RepID=A0AAD8EB60_DIPPU|nr:hypothetical protein L9F63_021612 [Diploptera punctata]